MLHLVRFRAFFKSLQKIFSIFLKAKSSWKIDHYIVGNAPVQETPMTAVHCGNLSFFVPDQKNGPPGIILRILKKFKSNAHLKSLQFQLHRELTFRFRLWSKIEILHLNWNLANTDLRETIESGPLCITDLFQNKSVAYFFNFFKLFQKKKKKL